MPAFHLIFTVTDQSKYGSVDSFSRNKSSEWSKNRRSSKSFRSECFTSIKRLRTESLFLTNVLQPPILGAPEYGGSLFRTLPFDRTPTSSTGELWVYTKKHKDGSIQDLVKTKVFF